jgi:(p)ppGpp synthase/HD superfamily hydrolase
MWITDPEALAARLVASVGAHIHADLAIRAADFAARVHAGQVRDDDSPYISHPLRTALILAEEFGEDEPELLAAALLHDSLEDGAGVSEEALAAQFGPWVAACVRTLTKPPRASGFGRDEVNAVYFPRVAAAEERVRLVKLADRLDNVRDLVHCPDPAKRRRMSDETTGFYFGLIASISSKVLRDTLMKAFDSALADIR